MEDALAAAVRTALAGLPDLPADFDPEAVAVEFQTPNDPTHGDLATNVAMQLARPLRRSPRTIADGIAAGIVVDPAQVEAVEVAGPGFLNIRFASAHLTAGLADVLAQGDAYGRTTDHAGETAIVEYVSANPTGPLTVGHGRNAVLGDTIATLLAWTGYDVTREYYFNDAGRQMRVLGQSVRARYQAIVRPGTPTKTLEDGLVVPESFPEDGYRGEYITDIARSLHDSPIDRLRVESSNEAEALEEFKAFASRQIMAWIAKTLHVLGVPMSGPDPMLDFDDPRAMKYFSESALYGDGREIRLDVRQNPEWTVNRVLMELNEKGLTYEEGGAVWFKTSALGKTVTTKEGDEEGKDVVLVKASGEPTYRLPDIAYHLDKVGRADLVLDVFGADHIATYPDVLRGVRALAGDAAAEKIDVVVYQFVTLVRGGQPVKMSTRKATYETLDDLMDEVGEAVTRFFFLMRAPGTHLEFDLDLAKEASEKNPVFYLQYAHARIASIGRKAAETGLDASAEAELSLLSHASEEALVKTLLQFPDEVRTAAEARAPHKLATFLRDVATAFNAFYRDCHIVGEETALATARLQLATATQTVLKNGLTILSIDAPESM